MRPLPADHPHVGRAAPQYRDLLDNRILLTQSPPYLKEPSTHAVPGRVEPICTHCAGLSDLGQVVERRPVAQADQALGAPARSKSGKLALNTSADAVLRLTVVRSGSSVMKGRRACRLLAETPYQTSCSIRCGGSSGK